MLAEKTPATFIAFDLLADGDEALLDTPFAERRQSGWRPGSRRGSS